MKTFQRFLMGLGTVAVLAVTLQLAAPKAVHAMVAALVRDADNPARATKFYLSCPAQSDDFGSIVCLPNYTVPAGQVLVVEQADTTCNLPDIYTQTPPTLDIVEEEQSHNHYLAWTSESFLGNRLYYRGNQAVRYYAGPGATFQFFADTSAPMGSDSCSFQLSGYLLSYP